MKPYKTSSAKQWQQTSNWILVLIWCEFVRD